jgi:hypothetical protein
MHGPCRGDRRRGGVPYNSHIFGVWFLGALPTLGSRPRLLGALPTLGSGCGNSIAKLGALPASRQGTRRRGFGEQLVGDIFAIY